MEKTFIFKVATNPWTLPIEKGVCLAETEEKAMEKLGLIPEIHGSLNLVWANCKSRTGSLFLLYEIKVFNGLIPHWW
jgi:hypothetical protein